MGLPNSVATLKKILKNLDGPITKPKKTQGQISIHFANILGKIQLFPKNPTFPEKNSFLSAKISDGPFFSHNSNFHPFPAKIYYQTPYNSLSGQNLLPNSLK